jgi:hypothetical protein
MLKKMVVIINRAKEDDDMEDLINTTITIMMNLN